MKTIDTCPRCQERPSRRVLVNTSGRPAKCYECFAAPHHDHYLQSSVPGRRAASDKTAVEIDRLYRAELAKIQQRRRRQP